VFGPSIAALIVTGARGGIPAVLALLLKYVVWRVGWRRWLFAIGLALACGAIALAVSQLVRPRIVEVNPSALWPTFPVAILATLPFGPVPEELGWRGFALPSLMERTSPLRASLVHGSANGRENALLPAVGDPDAPSARLLYFATVAVLVLVAVVLASRLDLSHD